MIRYFVYKLSIYYNYLFKGKPGKDGNVGPRGHQGEEVSKCLGINFNFQNKNLND